MNAYEKSLSLGLTGSSAEQVEILQTLTVRDIPVKEVARLLREEGLLLFTGTEYAGDIETLVKTPGIPSEFVAGIIVLKSAIFGGSAEVLLTTEPKWASQTIAIMSAIVAFAPDKTELIDRVYEFGGGRPHAALTVEDFDAQKVQYDQDAADAAAAEALRTKRDGLRERFDAILNQVSTVEQSLAVAALRVMADELEAE